MKQLFPEACRSLAMKWVTMPSATEEMDHSGRRRSPALEEIFWQCMCYKYFFLASQIAVHSVVEKLFRSIWTLPNNKAPVAIKYFFDFLDAQAENKKIADPDVVHIWKTNRCVFVCAFVSL